MTASDEAKARRIGFIINVLICSPMGIAWDVLAALVLFRRYSFFESVVVCLLVMILSSIATIRADLEPGGLLERRPENSDELKKYSDLGRELRSSIKGIFYGIAFVMAIVKLVLALVAAW
jgi:hypothetical protein